MKKILLTVIIGTVSIINAQVIIGDAVGTVPAGEKQSILLEFAAGQNKGIIVPYVRSLPTGSALVGGAIILDVTTPASAKMKYYDAVNASWVDLSGAAASGNLTTLLNDTQPTAIKAPESTTSKVIIGNSTSPVDGALVLESDTKAMVLPIVGTILQGGLLKVNVSNPSPGMMVYVNTTGAKRLAVYNGSKWSFWKP